METTRALNLNGKTRNLLWSVGLVLQKECVKLVSDQEILLCWLPPTAMETHLSRVREISPSRAQSSSLASGFSLPMAGNPSFTKRRTTLKKRGGDVPSVLTARRNTAWNSINQIQITKITSYKKTTVDCNSREKKGTLCIIITRTVVSPRKKTPKELRSRNSRIQIHSWFGRWTSRMKFVPTTVYLLELWCGQMKSIPARMWTTESESRLLRCWAYCSEKTNGQLFLTERNGSPSCGAECKSRYFQCQQWREVRSKDAAKKSQRQWEGNVQRPKSLRLCSLDFEDQCFAKRLVQLQAQNCCTRWEETK